MMTDLEIDSETGLPKVPNGFYWHVGRVGWYGTDIRVALIKPHSYIESYNTGFYFMWRLWFNKVIEETKTVQMTVQEEVLSIPLEELTKDRLLEITTRVYKKYLARIENEKLLGNYPPNSIKEGEIDE